MFVGCAILDHSKYGIHSKMKYCPNYSAVITAYDVGNNCRFLLRTRCKQWNCPYCAPKNMREWRYRIMATIEEYGDNVDWYLWTLTLSPKHHKSGSTAKSLRVWRKHWNKLMGKVKYRLGKFMYIRVFETHKSGILHVHMLANATFDDVVRIKEYNDKQEMNIRNHSEKMEKIMVSYGLGKIHDIKPIVTDTYEENGHARNVSAYVTKYLTKDIQSDVRLTLKKSGMENVRMIQTSHGWVAIEGDNKYKWVVGNVLYSEYDTDLINGVKLYDLNYGHEVEAIDFHKDGNHVVYPSPNEK